MTSPIRRSGQRGWIFVGCWIVVIISIILVVTSCAALNASIEDFNRELKGISATVTTYDQQGHRIDQVHGRAIQVHRDGDFDSSGTSSNGTSINIPNSEVLQIMVGNHFMHHVGSSMCINEDGLAPISNAPTRVELENNDSGRPWLNYFLENNRNLWGGRAKTIMIRSQDGLPIEVYAGDQVEIYATDIPKSTRFRVDGKFLMCYRVDYTVTDTQLLLDA